MTPHLFLGSVTGTGAQALTMVARHWRDALEIALLWIGIHLAWGHLRETRGARILTGVAIGSVLVLAASELLRLPVLDWLLRNVAALGLFALIVIFQPELRRAAASLGNNRLFSNVQQSRESVEVLSELTFELANRQLGALIAIERDVPLDAWIQSGVEIDGQLSTELVVSIFFPRTPLHDGGLIVKQGRVSAAGCILPVSDRVDIDRNLGLRHRAALGLAEETDALVIVVSEETGTVSICHQDIIERGFDPASLRARLNILLLNNTDEQRS